MLRIAYMSVLVFLLSAGCKEEVEPLPIPEEKLVPVLTDVHLAEAALQNLYNETRDSVEEVYYNQIYHIHSIRREEFEQTMEQLREDPYRMERIYTKVMELLAEEETRVQ